MLGDVAATLDAIAERLGSGGPCARREADAAGLRARCAGSGRPSDLVILALLEGLDRDAPIVTEGSAEDALVQDMAVALGFRDVHFSPRGGGLGWAMPLAVGIGLATGRHAACFVGDGGSLFSIHALWTAAKHRIPSIFVCFVNREYRILKDLWCQAMGTSLAATRFVGMDFADPDVDIAGIATALGARVERLREADETAPALARSLAHPGPSFLIIEREP